MIFEKCIWVLASVLNLAQWFFIDWMDQTLQNEVSEQNSINIDFPIHIHMQQYQGILLHISINNQVILILFWREYTKNLKCKGDRFMLFLSIIKSL